MKKKKTIRKIIYYVLVTGIGFLMIYPLIWMIMSSFKETNSIFLTASSLIPEKFTLENYINGWKGFAKISFGTFFKNSAFISITATIGTVISSSLVAFGLSRCRFKGKKLLFGAVLLTMMVPSQIDGCSYFGIYARIASPLMVPALVTAGIFSFIWRWDDFMSALLYINDAEKYPVCLALKLFTDPGSTSDFGAMFAMSTLSILPVLLIFIFFQKYLVEGISTSGLKG